MDIIFSGESIYVKPIRKVTGKIGYGLYRPYGKKSPFMEYDNADEAVFIAKFVDENGGDFGAEARRTASLAWKVHLLVPRLNRFEEVVK
jgi:hypothetical protein